MTVSQRGWRLDLKLNLCESRFSDFISDSMLSSKGVSLKR